MSPVSKILRRVRPYELAVFGELPLVVLGFLLWLGGGSSSGVDFRVFRRAGEAVLHGASPYTMVTLSTLSRNDNFVYPEPFAYPFIPLTWLPSRLGSALFLLASVGCLALGLRLLGVHDWRAHSFILLTAPVFVCLGNGALEPLLVLAVGAAWRLRNSAWSGVMLALAAAAKLFLWPLLVWLVVTRRVKASLAACATLVTLGCLWLLTDPAGLRAYPRTLRLLEQGHPSSYSLRGFWIAARLPAADTVTVVAALAGVLLLIRLRRQDRGALVAAVMVALFATPIMWLHYLVLLLVPLALMRPRLGRPWLLLLVLWLTPLSDPLGSLWRIAVALSVGLAVWVVSVRPGELHASSTLGDATPAR